jgi:hypothetical protein
MMHLIQRKKERLSSKALLQSQLQIQVLLSAAMVAPVVLLLRRVVPLMAGLWRLQVVLLHADDDPRVM